MRNSTNRNSLSTDVENALASRQSHLRPPARTCVVVPDATRPLPVAPVVRPLLKHLVDTGSPTSLLVGLGLHRSMTDAELEPLRHAAHGLDVDIVQHDAHGDGIVALGHADNLPPTAPPQLPIALNRHITDAERVICVGTVEPHQYAGFSGGIKAISIGCAGAETISAMHGLELLRDPKTTLGLIDDNPFQQSLWRIAESLGDVLGLQLVPAPDRGVAELFFEDVESAFRNACDVAASIFFEDVDKPLDWLHLPVPEVKASNFYQASRAATYAALVDRTAIRSGGAIIVEACCPEGMGRGSGERACAEAMRRGREQLLAELKGETAAETRGGQQRAYVLARACEQNRIALVGAPPIDELSAIGIEQFGTVDEAMDAMGLDERRGRRIDDVFHQIPRLESDNNRSLLDPVTTAPG